ncbi:helix-turn-helix transcriptional regulator [Spongiactinospora sp. TRM90649]|uniref:helix-turn-helix domain-containing protein n=1 Tax=Spongiactinospora sp. TRM90649 TaxID=3031114 RepID=UPI0023F76AC1|nr:helix-turn-helix transcriptional regulator [Spongiactinospora sp. TRM90649]MDF5752358.1 helix-turn-helix transcriptional regulator [Spongiactinospora sp. TRM90649]
MSTEDAGQALARRLRSLREDEWPDTRITQLQLAQALGGDRPLSVPLISSWESLSKPKIPPVSRLEAYATLFATRRSVDTGHVRMPDPAGLSPEERARRGELYRELQALRAAALRGLNDPARRAPVGGLGAMTAANGDGPWLFAEGEAITLVCAQLPPDMRERMPYADPDDPDFIELYTYADLDALFELHGHVRALNPRSQVNLRVAQRLQPDDYTTHLVLLGGVDWNHATQNVLNRLSLPVRQIADWENPAGPYFEVSREGGSEAFYPILERVGDGKRLVGDVGHFYRGQNPYNRKRTISICNGMYGRGVHGVVRALTDARFRDRNAEHVAERFGDAESYSILTRVTIEGGVVLTPDWTIPDNLLHEWSDPTE